MNKPFADEDLAKILERIENGEKIEALELEKLLVKQVRDKNKFEHGEIIFKYLRETAKHKRQGSIDIGAFQRGLFTLIRYAPTLEKALSYANMFFVEIQEPLRTPYAEVVVLTNLLVLLNKRHTVESMKLGLRLIQLIIDIGVFRLNPNRFWNEFSVRSKDAIQVLLTVCDSVLRYHRLQLNSDRSGFIPIKR
ncbi:uncharacterized protein B0P05DRAFT_576057 [Gilbertella persicaria]|uniref:uncharacterized protein n=1 Tax=Gilbertella persicaria TaxID=101096 RepID=UPI002220B3ED|nr:uncharacterized protein B0P05DRAFT_576057 [Gilbertella persicaria]KAI8048354.1 hypothetical protein B0P05DRAFT_576057 [Gilbertella persicaria]